MPYTIHVISHTHWDREWYLPFEVFRLRLVDLIDNLLDILDTDPDFRHFSLDAQTIVLEDYLAIRPQARTRLEAHVKAGRVAVGPWFQLNDEYLVSGEATLRSLLIGHRVASEFGQVTKVGYLPDQFGNISQMPQILRGFGIDNAIMGRGRQLGPGDTMEFWWEGADGTRVLASLMAYWYNNAQYIPVDPEHALQFIEQLRNTMGPRSACRHLLLMNGVDHLEAQPTIGKTIAGVQALMGADRAGDRLVHSSLEAYVDGLRSDVERGVAHPSVVRGELRQDGGGACLAGTLSARTYLKQANFAAQNALERYAEPLAAFARLQGAAYPGDELRYAWKLLMENHPHDSICGCSIDQVHDEMMPRFDRVRQVAGVLEDRALDVLTGRDRTRGATALPCDLYVFNTLNWARTDPVKVPLEFPLGPPARGNAQRDAAAMVHGLRIVGPDGAEAPFGMTANETCLVTVSNPHELPLDQWVQRITIEFVAHDVPACGYAVYRLEAVPVMPAYPTGPSLSATADVPVWPGLPRTDDVGDVGDEYLHRPPMNDLRITQWLDDAVPWMDRFTPVRWTQTTLRELRVPRCGDASGRSPEMVSLPVHFEKTNWLGVARTEFRLILDNYATDHRLRALFDVGGSVVAGAPFDVVSRDLTSEELDAGASPFHPMTLWVDSTGVEGMRGLTIAVPGLYEYEVRKGFDPRYSQVGVTLLRCVSQLSGRGDGPGISTPGAQCQGRHVFDMAVAEHDGDWEAACVWKQADQFAVPLVAVQAPSTAKPRSRSYVEVEPDGLVLSALKSAEARDSLIVRFYNTTTREIGGGRVRVDGSKRWRQVNLNEEPLGEWTDGEEALLAVGAKRIVTLEFEL